MFQNLELFRTAMAMASNAGTRQAVTAQNIANADTPGYKARVVSDFSDTVRSSDFAIGPGNLSLRASRGSHLMGQDHPTRPIVTESRDSLDPNGNGVVLEDQMLSAVQAKRDHDRALAIYRSGMTILRTSLGRG